jgi:hypothetical protein
MVAIEVASAMWITCSEENPRATNVNERMGTITAPPPMPKRPAKKPTKQPASK